MGVSFYLKGGMTFGVMVFENPLGGSVAYQESVCGLFGVGVLRMIEKDGGVKVCSFQSFSF